MEIILAIVVASAVIFFGALISMGNERQRNAIDDLREQITLWAKQDLRINRERLKTTMQPKEPLTWLSYVASTIFKQDIHLTSYTFSEASNSLVCETSKDTIRVVYSPHSPNYFLNLNKQKKNQLSKFNTLKLVSKKQNCFELSILNMGYFFDLELAQVWEITTGKKYNYEDKVWIYKLE